MGKNIISAALAVLCISFAAAQDQVTPDSEPMQAAPQEAPALVESPPSRYVVVKGDTLWGIATRFLRDPWRWPDIWGLNRDQIKNPHWIYPGDVIVLDLSGATPRLRFEGDGDWQLLVTRLRPRIRTQGLPPSAIPSIPAANLNAFLTRPLIVAPHELASAPRIIAAQETRVVLGPGDTAYAQGLVPSKGTRYHVIRPGRRFVDPDTRELLGLEAQYLGEAGVQEFGEVSTLKIVGAVQEIAPGDLLVDAPPTSADPYMPRAPQSMVRGKIIAGPSDAVSEIGPQSVVVLNRGARDGLELGHVLAILRAGERVQPAGATNARARVKLPDERYGIVFVFRVFDRLSYALVMNTTRPVHVNDIIRTP
ncbi:MAG TPA: LysM peptidoglycan-binding domain-containing protein [Burkholderiales bacterium]|jgi:hypothetical protein|nr:LysM peptidoglycan-binding domain-containing protein [Burkholderiales bacterium]